MNLTINKLNKRCVLTKEFNSLKVVPEDTEENKKKYGIPYLPIISKEPIIIKSKDLDVDTKKYIALTFDNSITKNTDMLLDILNKNHVRATFFVYGNTIMDNVDLIKRVISCGNELGIHGYSKTKFTLKTIDEIKDDIDITLSIFNNISIYPTHIVRPPFNKLNETIKENIGIPLVLSNIDTTNSKIQTKEEIIDSILKNVTSGSIIEMSLSKISLEALEEVLPMLIEDGYKIVSVSEMNRRYSNEFMPGMVYAKIKSDK